MKNTSRPYQLTLYCKCGEKLVKYKKGGGRRLVKVHADRVTKDFQNLFIHSYPEDTNIPCPSCNNRIATVKNINGKYVNKLNVKYDVC